MGRRQTGASATREKIVTAAMDLIRTRGFERVKVEDITKAAGVSKGSFYVYFERKEEVVHEYFQTFFASINQEVQAGSGDLGERIKRYVRRFMEGALAGGLELTREWLRSVVDPRDYPDEMYGGKYHYDVKAIRGIFEKAITSGELKKTAPVETLTYLIVCEIKGMALCWCMSDGEFDPVVWSDRFCDLQIKGILEPYRREGQVTKNK